MIWPWHCRRRFDDAALIPYNDSAWPWNRRYDDTPEEFEKLALQQIDMLYRVARRLTRESAAADDLVQETYLRAIRFREGFQLQEHGIRPWLLRIMHNLHFSRSQRDHRQPAALEDGQLEAAGLSSRGAELPINPATFDAMDERLVAALEKLPAEYGSVLLLWAVEELSYKEIAAALEIPIGTVMSRLHRVRERLATDLASLAAEQRLVRE